MFSKVTQLWKTRSQQAGPVSAFSQGPCGSCPFSVLTWYPKGPCPASSLTHAGMKSRASCPRSQARRLEDNAAFLLRATPPHSSVAKYDPVVSLWLACASAGALRRGAALETRNYKKGVLWSPSAS